MNQLIHSILLKYRNDDFVVDEVSLLPHTVSEIDSRQRFTLLRTTKEGYTTFEVMRIIAQFAGIDTSQVRCQGLKDEDGVTSQLLSLDSILKIDQVNGFNSSHKELEKGWVRLALVGYSNESVREKCLHGNIFKLRLRNVSIDDAECIVSFCDGADDFICANYYDQQRFGLPKGPFVAHLIGEAIIDGDWAKANAIYIESGNLQIDFPGASPQPGRDYLTRVDPRKISFFVAAYDSYVWNKTLSNDLKATTQTMTITDGIVVGVPDSGDKVRSVTVSDGYSLNDKLAPLKRSKSRASLISTTVYASNVQPDEFHHNKHTVDLQFFLPAGSYATMLVKQLLIQALA